MSHNPSGGLALFSFLACLMKQVLNQAKRIMIRQEVPQAVGGGECRHQAVSCTAAAGACALV